MENFYFLFHVCILEVKSVFFYRICYNIFGDSDGENYSITATMPETEIVLLLSLFISYDTFLS